MRGGTSAHVSLLEASSVSTVGSLTMAVDVDGELADAEAAGVPSSATWQPASQNAMNAVYQRSPPLSLRFVIEETVLAHPVIVDELGKVVADRVRQNGQHLLDVRVLLDRFQRAPDR